MQLPGLHHVTAICGDPRANFDFYTRLLGLRFVKKTVNFDDPTTYHLYYGDTVGSPGSAMTFFPWAGIRRGAVGTGQAAATAWSVSPDSLPFWSKRLLNGGATPPAEFTRFGETGLRFQDKDGLVLELIGTSEPDARKPWAHGDIPLRFGLRGFHSVTLMLPDAGPTLELMTGPMGFREIAREGNRIRLATGAGGPGSYVDLHADPSLPRGRPGSGTVHHVAFRTNDDATQASDLGEVLDFGLHASPVMDRNYFHSIYFREPGNVLFEVATDGPGFTVDEPAETLGSRLMLPSQYASRRAEIEASLPPLDHP